MKDKLRKYLKRTRKKILIIIAVIGPGIITAFADNDAGGVATYSVSAARYGYSMLTTLIPVTFVLMITQEIGSRMAIVTGKGLGDLIRERYSIKISLGIFILLFFVNFAVILQNIGGLKDALGLFNLNIFLFLPLLLLILFLFITKASYKKIENFFLFLIFFYVTYFISAVLAKPDWGKVMVSLVKPDLKDLNFGYIYTSVAVLGTTVTAWGQFFINSYVKDKQLTPDKLKYNQWEIYLGSILTDVFSLFIMVAVIATLYTRGVTIKSALDAAQAVKPFAGELASFMFGLGLFVSGFIGAAIVPLTTAYAFSEFFGYEGSLDEDFSSSKVFYIIFLIQIILGALVVIIPNFSLFQITLYASFVNGLFLPVIFYFLYKFANDADLMGSYKNSPLQNFFLLTACGIITIAACIGGFGELLGF